MQDNIVLIGMPGAGKSTVGVLLAKVLKMPFIDTDLLIQSNCNRLLQEIIDTDGFEKFLNIEENIILGLDLKNHLISTGGSVIYRNTSMEMLKKSGIVIYLKIEYTDMIKRIKNIQTRGIAMGNCKNLKCLFEERAPLYQKYADITVECTGRHVEDVLIEIRDLLHKKLN